jgi:hypothetical protein
MSSIFQLPEPIESKLYISHSSINNKSKSSIFHHHERVILEHPFNNKIEIFIPNFNDNKLKKENKELFLEKLNENKEWFYYKVDLKLSYFLEKNFIDNYLKKGIYWI